MATEQPPVLAKDVPAAMVPEFGPGSKVNWDSPSKDPNKRPHIGATGTVAPQTAEFGPGTQVNWDNPKLDPTKRKHVGLDPTGVQNAKLL